MKINIYFYLNNDKSKAYQNLWDTTKAMLKRKHIAQVDRS